MPDINTNSGDTIMKTDLFIPDKFYKGLMYIAGGIILLLVYNNIFFDTQPKLYKSSFSTILFSSLMWLVSSIFKIYKNKKIKEREYYKTGELKKEIIEENVGIRYIIFYGTVMFILLVLMICYIVYLYS